MTDHSTDPPKGCRRCTTCGISWPAHRRQNWSWVGVNIYCPICKEQTSPMNGTNDTVSEDWEYRLQMHTAEMKRQADWDAKVAAFEQYYEEREVMLLYGDLEAHDAANL